MARKKKTPDGLIDRFTIYVNGHRNNGRDKDILQTLQQWETSGTFYNDLFSAIRYYRDGKLSMPIQSADVDLSVIEDSIVQRTVNGVIRYLQNAGVDMRGVIDNVPDYVDDTPEDKEMSSYLKRFMGNQDNYADMEIDDDD